MSKAKMIDALKEFRVALFEQAFDDLLYHQQGHARDPSKMVAVKAAHAKMVAASKNVSAGEMTQCFVTVMPLRGDF